MTSSPPTAPVQDRPAKPPRWRRAVRAVGWVLASLVILCCVWAGAQIALRRPYPTLLYTEADLPKLPTPEENGWDFLKVEIPSLGNLPRPDKDIAQICDGKATFTDRWPRATAQAEKLAALSRDEMTKKWLAAADKAAEHPRFADACPITFEPDCPRAIQLLFLHQVQEGAALHDALDQHWKEAFSRAVHMLRVDIDFLPSGRSALTQAVARAQVHRSITLVGVLLDGAESEKKDDRGPNAEQLAYFVRESDALIKSIREEEMDPMHAVVAEYLFSVHAIMHLTDAQQGQFAGRANFLYDPGRTLENLNDRFTTYAAYAKSGAVSALPEVKLSRFWFLLNPIGQLTLEISHGTLENQVPATLNDRSLLMKDQRALHERLLALSNAK